MKDKVSVIIAILEMLLKFLKDTDRDGRPDILDRFPNDSNKK